MELETYAEYKVCKDRQEWLNERLYGIGGSDASCILGKNPWKNNQQLWFEKVNKVYEEIEDNDAMRYGREAEEILFNLFKLKHDKEYTSLCHSTNSIFINHEFPYMRYSPDGLLVDKEGRYGLWECKTGKIKSASDSDNWRGRIPDNYYIQVLHGLLVGGFDFVVVNVELEYTDKDDNKYWIIKEYRIDRKDVLEDLWLLKTKEIEFWKSVENNIEPNLILTL